MLKYLDKYLTQVKYLNLKKNNDILKLTKWTIIDSKN